MEAKRKRNVLTLPQKMEIINLVNSGETRRSIAKKYSVGSTTISDLYKNRESIIHFMSVTKDEECYNNRRTMRKPHNDKVDRAVFIWFRQLRASGKPVSGPAICDKALFFNEKFSGGPEFKASNGWLRNFKVRHGIQRIENHDEATSSLSKESSRIYADLSDLVKQETQRTDPSYQAGDSNPSTKPLKSLASKLEANSLDLPYLGDEEIFRLVEEEHRENCKKIAAIAESKKAAKNEKKIPPITCFKNTLNPFENNEKTESFLQNSIADNLYDSRKNNLSDVNLFHENSILESACNNHNQYKDVNSHFVLNTSEIPTHCEAYTQFNNIIDWCTSQNKVCATQLHVLQQLRNLAAKKRDVKKSLEIVMRWCKSQKECSPEQLETLRQLHSLTALSSTTD